MAEIIALLWMLQYLGVFLVWISVTVLGIWCHVFLGYRDRSTLLTIWAGVYYLAIETQWMLEEAEKHPSYTEWWWSGFEGLVGLILLLQLMTRRTHA